MILSRVEGFPRDQLDNATYLARLMKDYPNVDAVETCQEYEVWHMDNPGGTKNYKQRLNNFFKKASRDAHGRAPRRQSVSEDLSRGQTPQGTPQAGIMALAHDPDVARFVSLARTFDFSTGEIPTGKHWYALGGTEDERGRNLAMVQSVTRRGIREAG